MYYHRRQRSPTNGFGGTIPFIVGASLPHLVHAKLSDGGVAGLVVGTVVGLVIGVLCVWKIAKADNEQPSMAYASNQSRTRANDAAQVQAETEIAQNKSGK
jgi:undecaprenyl pyrophosphate phosphatase UppP